MSPPRGTARAGSDYTFSGGTLTIAAGQTSATISVPVLADAVTGPDETFVLSLSSATNATLLDDQGRGTIQNGAGSGTTPSSAPTLTKVFATL